MYRPLRIAEWTASGVTARQETLLASHWRVYTGAARLQSLVQALGVKIVLIEEAAEVLEAHVLACLAPSIQQLILIGGVPMSSCSFASLGAVPAELPRPLLLLLLPEST